MFTIVLFRFFIFFFIAKIKTIQDKRLVLKKILKGASEVKKKKSVLSEEVKIASEAKMKIPEDVQEKIILFFLQTSIPRKAKKKRK